MNSAPSSSELLNAPPLVVARDHNASDGVSRPRKMIVRARMKLSWILMKQTAKCEALNEITCFRVRKTRTDAFTPAGKSTAVAGPLTLCLG